MAEESDQERTEEATQQRREDFRKRGQVVQSKELASVFSLFLAAVGIWMLGGMFGRQLIAIFESSLTSLLVDGARSDNWMYPLKVAAEKTALLVAPVLGIAWLVSFSSSIVQIGFLYNEEAMKFDPERLNPISGMKRVFSLTGLFEGVKALLKLIIISVVAYYLLRAEFSLLPGLVNMPMGQLMSFIGAVVIKLLSGIGFAMLVLAAFDYFYQRWDLEKKMMMTKQEIKEELKSREGDPLIKARIRRVQRELANKRMMDDVPKADVIITNPTHIAVALKYDETMVAPRLLAKGANLIAEKIKQVARDNNVPVVENKPLARTIYKTLDIGQMVPRELYTAVAEVLSYVYKLKGKVKA